MGGGMVEEGKKDNDPETFDMGGSGGDIIIVNNYRRSLGTVGVTVRGWNSTISYFGHTLRAGDR